MDLVHFKNTPIGAIHPRPEGLGFLASKDKIGPIPEAGNIVYFNIKDCAIVQPENQGKGKVCILEVEAPNLDKLRKKYGLGKRFHPYHITIGIQDK